MKETRFRDKKEFIRTERKLGKKHYLVIIGLMVFGVIYHYFIKPKTIGYDIRYSIYIFWLPTIMGMIALGIYRRQFLINLFAVNRGIFLRTFMTFFYLAQGLIFSYLSFGQVAKTAWDYCQYSAVRQHTDETLACEITRFWTKRSHGSIDFKLNGRHEHFAVAYSDIQQYKDKDPENYELKINATMGIWNYYTVNSWRVVKIN